MLQVAKSRLYIIIWPPKVVGPVDQLNPSVEDTFILYIHSCFPIVDFNQCGSSCLLQHSTVQYSRSLWNDPTNLVKGRFIFKQAWMCWKTSRHGLNNKSLGEVSKQRNGTRMYVLRKLFPKKQFSACWRPNSPGQSHPKTQEHDSLCFNDVGSLTALAANLKTFLTKNWGTTLVNFLPPVTHLTALVFETFQPVACLNSTVAKGKVLPCCLKKSSGMVQHMTFSICSCW
jgi:hypothetical protein